jgi:outer membrane protein
LRSRSYFLPLLFLLLAGVASAQSELEIQQPQGGLSWLTGPYRQRTVPQVDLNNSPRIDSLVRAGNLYLSAQDAVALAIENNIDIEVQRYAPLLAREVLQRAEGGGVLRSVGLGVAAGPQSVSLQGISVNVNTAGLSVGGNGVGSGGGIVTQLGPSIPNLDPQLNLLTSFQHATSPQSNTFLTGTTALIQSTRNYQAQLQKNFVWGMTSQLTYNSQHFSVNSQSFNLNPYTTGTLDLQVTQNLLQGFGAGVNGRNIRVQRNNVKVSQLQFKQQVIATVSAVLNLYWDLVSFRQDVQARERELAAAQQLLDDNSKQVEIGTLPQIEITRAEAQVFTARQDLLVSQTNEQQQEIVLKNALVRDGIQRANLSSVHIIPLDHFEPPAQQATRPEPDLEQEALKQRVEIQQSQLNVDSNKLNLVGIRSSLKPTLQVFAQLTNNGLTGELSALGAGNPAVDYLAGGYGNLLAQIFRRNYPNYSAGVSLNIPLRNRAAQSDYVTSQLELRQNELNLEKNVNQVRVDVQSAVIGLQQAQARYEAAQRAHVLQQQTLDADQQKLREGVTTPYQIVTDQQNLASAISSETQALANYSHAEIALDQALGRTLDVNHISIDEAMSGHVNRPSALPTNLPPPDAGAQTPGAQR